MTRGGVFGQATKLWHPVEGWRAFPKGEQDPGMAWSEREGGDLPVVEDTTALKKRLADAEDLYARRMADLDRVAQERDDANRKVAGLEKRAGEAEKALAEAQADKIRYAQERDRAIQNEANVRRENEALKASRDADRTRIMELEADLANAQAQVSAFDGDGDGRVGGRKRKAEGAQA